MLDCLVIGAGPGGLVCTKELLEQGLDNVLCLEQADRIGGVFANTYDNLVLTSSATFSMFSDFWIGDGNEHAFWTKQEALEYWGRYAQQFSVLEKIRFNAKVMAVEPDEQGWQVRLESGETLETRRVALAIGNNAIANYPDWHTQLTDIEYCHSKVYRNADHLKGKNVLVVGGGESGSDMALEAAQVANQCWISLRASTGWVAPRRRGANAADISTHRGVWGLPRDFGAALTQAIYQAEWSQNDPVHDTVVTLNQKIGATKGVWGTFGTKTFSLPKAIVHHNCQVVGEVVNVSAGGRVLQTADGHTLDNIDVIIFATGYKNHVAFLPEALQQTDPRSLYKHMFHPKYRDTLAWIGWARPGFGSQFPIMEMQARLFALLCAGERTLPSPSELEKITCLDRAANLDQFEHNAHRIRSLVDYHRYMDNLADLIGCQPPLWSALFSQPRLWLTMVYGATQGTQFRLRGPGCKPALAQSLLQKLPVSKPTHIVKAGLKGRLLYAAKSLIPQFGALDLRELTRTFPSLIAKRSSI